MRTILFVDDEPASIQVLRMLLEARDYECVCRRDMTSALNYLRSNKVSVLVSDIMMPTGPDFPEIDSSEAGFHLVSMVRKEFPLLGIICLSVIGDQGKINALKRKKVLYLRKGETPLDTAVRLIESKATGVISFP